MFHGIIPIYKPKGYTSHDVVNFVRRVMAQKKVGHTGTLDPEVEGVLPICLGQATRIAEYIQDRPKQYEGVMTVGVSTTTEDQTGEVIERQCVSPPLIKERVEEVFRSFLGVSLQVPPMYSAVKVNGKRLYELARQGKRMKRPPREITIYSLKCLWVKNDDSFPTIAFNVICSKGTYIRTLCVDIGKKLGYPAHLSSLVRTRSGPFHAEDCYSLDQLKKLQTSEEKQSILYSIDEALGNFPSMIIHDSDVQHVENGLPLEVESSFTLPYVRIYSESGKFCALYRCEGGIAKPEKVFRDVTN